MKFNILCALALLLYSCQSSTEKQASNNNTVQESYRKQISQMLDSFNVAAAQADFDKYFGFFATDATFMGTDATEYWNKKDFMVWAKPYFDKKTTWNFQSISRHIYFNQEGNLAWFDELLKTQMKICRGSGVVVQENNTWKVMQYVLSQTIPNGISNAVVKLKGPIEDSLMKTIIHSD